MVAWIEGAEVGVVREEGGVWSWQYAENWLINREAYSLCPELGLKKEAIVDGGSRRPVQWYFDNLLPEEGQRKDVAKHVKVGDADSFGLLKSYGTESVGSVTLLPKGIAYPVGDGLKSLSNERLEKRILDMPRMPLSEGAAKRMSLAGAQYKLAMVLTEEGLFEPIGLTPSTHILKPDHPGEDYKNSVINEWFVMSLAQRVGLQVPVVHRRYVPSPVYIVKRFDRNPKGRLHVIDACQLLGLAKEFKYSEGSVGVLKDMAEKCRSKGNTRVRLFQWVVFNVLIGNTDAHLKNLSFLVTREGIELAPFYDLLSVAVFTRAFDRHEWP